MSGQSGNRAAELLAELNLVRAADLAADGHYREAEQILSGSDATGSVLRAQAYDLTARIRAQQSRYREARELWLLAINLNPQCADYQAALRRINKIEGSFGLFYKNPVLARFIIVAAVLLATLVAWSYSPLMSPAGNQAIEAPSTSPIKAPVKAADSDVPLLPSIPGVREQVHGKDRIVDFEVSLFSEGTTLKKDAEIILQKLATTLQPHKDRIYLHVVGCADKIPVSKTSPYRDNADLGFRRALKVAEILRASTGIPSESVFIQDAGQQPSAARNRNEWPGCKKNGLFLRSPRNQADEESLLLSFNKSENVEKPRLGDF